MTSDRTTRSPAPGAVSGPGLPPPARPSRWAWLVAVLAVLVLAAGVLITLLVRGGGNRTATPSASSSVSALASASASTSASTSTSVSASASASQATSGSASTGAPGQPAPALLPRGTEAPRTAIPWARVDDGWNLRAWSTKADHYSLPLTPSTLYLVNPIGGRYRIATLPPDTYPVSWSPDRRYAVLHSYGLLREYDLTTGRQLAAFSLGDRILLSYAGPHSLLLGRPAADNQIGLDVVGTDGRTQRSLLGGAPGGYATALYRPDGPAFLIAGRGAFLLVGTDGRQLRRIGYPSGAQQCRTTHWWSGQVALGTCHYPTPGNGSGVDNLVLVPVDGHPVSLLTHSTSPYHSYLDGWRYSGGVLAAVASGSCGIADLATLDSAGNSHPYSYRMPAGLAEQVSVLGVHGDRVSLLTSSCDTRDRSLVGLDLRTGVASALLGPGLNGGSVW